jgi:hypothetical protein
MDFKKMKMSPNEKKAKMSVLKDLHGQASDLMKQGLAGAKDMKKVTVASDSKEGLKQGLEKAEDLLGEQDEDDSVMGGHADDEAAEHESAQDESEPMDEDELDAKIQELLQMKEKLQR